eukprot:TRINITY_DN106942_c0_g1_i1.p1 TRINITY_DN106942_c0_g1~~TRINITY_DN106942_c0_g1_i1.p1  ORF type:complete len:297 (-),score=52.98 TRINITY_DN106942_c0_g1_i1:147-1037(-)
MWKVVGGLESLGILVREGEDLASSQLPQRLATGAVVKELEMRGNRLNYKLISGSGPLVGWVSISLHGRALCKACVFKAAHDMCRSVDEGRCTSAVLFDLFGTLLFMAKKRLPWTKLFGTISEAARLEGLGTFDESKASLYVQTHDGPPCQVAAQAVHSQLPEFNVERVFVGMDFEAQIETEANSVELYPDSLETLRRLQQRGLKLALVSNLATPYSNALDLCGIRSFFDEVIFSFAEAVAKGQPGDHRIYHLAAQRLGVLPRDCLFVGDTVAADFQGPLAAGMQAVHLDRRARCRA